MEILYQGKKYNAYPSDHFAVEEAVCVNGVTGWIDYTGFDKIVIVDENNFRYHIKYVDIESVYILYRNSIVDFNGKHKRIMPYNWRGAKDKQPKADKSNRREFTAKEKNLTMGQIAKALNIDVSDIIKATVSHTFNVHNILETEPIYEYSTYKITTK